jgi:hypothetical protein
MLKKLPQAVPLETSSRINEDIQMFYIESTLDSLAGPSGNEQLTSHVCEAETCSHNPPMLSETTQPPKHIRRPTQKARQALEDTLPEGPGPLEGDTGQPMEDTSLEPEAFCVTWYIADLVPSYSLILAVQVPVVKTSTVSSMPSDNGTPSPQSTNRHKSTYTVSTMRSVGVFSAWLKRTGQIQGYMNQFHPALRKS